MRIMIQDTEPEVKVSFETKEAPCPGCDHFKDRRENNPAKCMVEDRPLSSSVIESCARFGWRQG